VLVTVVTAVEEEIHCACIIVEQVLLLMRNIINNNKNE
jgi:hypothetical protein